MAGGALITEILNATNNVQERLTSRLPSGADTDYLFGTMVNPRGGDPLFVNKDRGLRMATFPKDGQTGWYGNEEMSGAQTPFTRGLVAGLGIPGTGIVPADIKKEATVEVARARWSVLAGNALSVQQGSFQRIVPFTVNEPLRVALDQQGEWFERPLERIVACAQRASRSEDLEGMQELEQLALAGGVYGAAHLLGMEVAGAMDWIKTGKEKQAVAEKLNELMEGMYAVASKTLSTMGLSEADEMLRGLHTGAALAPQRARETRNPWAIEGAA